MKSIILIGLIFGSLSVIAAPNSGQKKTKACKKTAQFERGQGKLPSSSQAEKDKNENNGV